MAGSPDDDRRELGELRAARPAQDDPIARRLEARVRAALVGADVAPARIDRFEVLARLGAGGMGVVYAAFDPRLDRRVAIKVLHAAGDPARARVLAEARALARLSHPGVVAVYDASDLGDDLTITMELVDGGNLRRWLAAAPRSTTAVLDVVVAAGRGLAAAHAAGLIHGDVKPENILVAADGAAKVADFGLARAEHGDDHDPTKLSGTPAYMAPELLAGARPDPRSDQFAFAVTAYEALAGRRPYAGTTVDELRAATRAAAVPALPRGVPARIGRALERALAPDPAARFPSMPALLAAIERPPMPRAVLAAAIAAPLVVAGGVLAFALTRHGAAACDGGERAIEAAISAGDHAALAPRVDAVITGYTSAWSAQRRLTCAATRDGDQSAAMLDRRMACLDRRLGAVTALVRHLRGTPAPTEPDALEAAYALPPLEPCAELERLAAIEPPPAAIAGRVAELERRLADTGAIQRSDPRTALAAATAIVADARGLAYPPVLADALNLLGKLQIPSDAAAADATLKLALAAATAARDDDLVAEVWAARIFVVGLMQGKLREALAYGEAAEAAAARMTAPSMARAQIKTYVAELLAEQDQLPAARTLIEDAVAMLEEVRGPNHPLVGESLTVLADIALAQGDLAAARRAATRSHDLFLRAYGAGHQEVLVAGNLLANIAFKDGDFDGALDQYQSLLAETIAAVGERHANTAVAHTNVGDTLRRLGRLDEARVELEAARADFEQTSGLGSEGAIKALASLAKLEPDPARQLALLDDVLARRIALFGADNRVVADTLDDLGNAARDAGQLDRAGDYFARAITTFERSLGPDDPRIAVPLSNSGELAIERGHFEDAIAACDRALALDTAALGADHPDLAYDLTCLGEARLGAGDHAGAVEALERASTLRVEGTAAPDEIVRTRFGLASALWRTGDRARARSLAEGARPLATPGQTATIDRWLRAHPVR